MWKRDTGKKTYHYYTERSQGITAICGYIADENFVETRNVSSALQCDLCERMIGDAIRESEVCHIQHDMS